MRGHDPETHNYGQACARTGLAAPQWPTLDIQKIHRLGLASRTTSGGVEAKTVERHEHQDGGGVKG